MTTNDERRINKRHNSVNLDAVVLKVIPKNGKPHRLFGSTREVTIRSLSLGGLAIEANIEDDLPFDIELGSRITLSFILPHVTQIARVEAEVVRTYQQVGDNSLLHIYHDGSHEEDFEGNGELTFGMGLRFLDLTDEVARRLRESILKLAEQQAETEAEV